MEQEKAPVVVGDCFVSKGRRQVFWRVTAIVEARHIGKVFTLGEIDGTGQVKVGRADLDSGVWERTVRPQNFIFQGVSVRT